MFERHFGLRENPFHSGHQLRFLYPSREHQEARAHLRYGIENREPFVLITGEVGTGKTTALYDALDEWGSQVAVALITNSALTRQELLEEICLRFGLTVPAGTSKPQALSALERHLTGVKSRGEHAVLILDEAQNLASELLEEIRLLSNVEQQGEKLLQIFLVGQPELEAKLARPELRQLRQRISVHYRLNPLSPEETAGYIHHRIAVAGGNAWATFPPETCREVYRVTHGIPREINHVASQALLAAFTDNTLAVRPEHVRASASESEFQSVLGEMPDDDPALAAFGSGMAAPAAPAPPAPVAPAVVTPPAPVAPPPPPVAATPAPEPAPAWSPPVIASEPVRHAVELVDRDEIDAWNAAARELLEARRRQAGHRPEAENAPPAPTPISQAMAQAHENDEAEARFPSPAELEAHAPYARPDAADLSGLPARLRDKIEGDIARENSNRRMVPMVLSAIGIAATLVGIVLLQRFQVIDVPVLRAIAGTPAEHGGKTPATTAPSSAPAPVVPATDSTKADTTTHASATPNHEAKPVPVATKPVPAAPKPATPAPMAPSTAAKPAAVDSTLYGVGVGSYLDRDRADSERAKLQDDTGLPGRIVPYKDSGTTMYRVVMGNWSNRTAAENAATSLMSRPGVKEGRVVVVGHIRTR